MCLIVAAHRGPNCKTARDLFGEYARCLPFDLDFQDFDEELAKTVIETAREIGYYHMRLDTVPTMTSANELYASLGFRPIAAYRFNPVEGAIYLELKL